MGCQHRASRSVAPVRIRPPVRQGRATSHTGTLLGPSALLPKRGVLASDPQHLATNTQPVCDVQCVNAALQCHSPPAAALASALLVPRASQTTCPNAGPRFLQLLHVSHLTTNTLNTTMLLLRDQHRTLGLGRPDRLGTPKLTPGATTPAVSAIHRAAASRHWRP